MPSFRALDRLLPAIAHRQLNAEVLPAENGHPENVYGWPICNIIARNFISFELSLASIIHLR